MKSTVEIEDVKSVSVRISTTMPLGDWLLVSQALSESRGESDATRALELQIAKCVDVMKERLEVGTEEET